MADTAIPPSLGKRQSTVEEEIDAKKAKRSESSSEKEKRVSEMTEKFKADCEKAVYMDWESEEEVVDLDNIMCLVVKYKAKYLGEGIWDNLIEYIHDNLPAGLERLADEGRGEQALIHMFRRALQNEAPSPPPPSESDVDDFYLAAFEDGPP